MRGRIGRKLLAWRDGRRLLARHVGQTRPCIECARGNGAHLRLPFEPLEPHMQVFDQAQDARDLGSGSVAGCGGRRRAALAKEIHRAPAQEAEQHPGKGGFETPHYQPEQ